MFGIGLPELIVIFILALIVLGPKRLPEVARALGRGLGELKRAAADLKEEMEVDSRETDHELRDRSHIEPIKDPLSPPSHEGDKQTKDEM